MLLCKALSNKEEANKFMQIKALHGRSFVRSLNPGPGVNSRGIPANTLLMGLEERDGV
jgi:hypothetical protein